MESRRSNSASNVKQKSSKANNKATNNASGDFECVDVSESTSHTQFLRKKRNFDSYTRITRDTYYGQASDASSSSDSFGCVHGPGGKLYTESEQLKRAIRQKLDTCSVEPAWTASCPAANCWEIARELEFLVTDGAPLKQLDRLNAYLRDLATISQNGYRIDVLDSITVILDFLETTYLKESSLRESFVLLLKNVHQPILLNKFGVMAKYFDSVSKYMGFLGGSELDGAKYLEPQNVLRLWPSTIHRRKIQEEKKRRFFYSCQNTLEARGCLLLVLEEDELFGVVSDAMLWHLSAPDARRPASALRRGGTLLAAAPALYHAAARMLAVTSSSRFPTFLRMALLLASASQKNCIELVKENILENIFYRFNPYFPERKLPAYDINPADPQHHNVQLGDSSVHLHTTLTLLLVLAKALKLCCEKNPKFHEQLPAPDNYAQSCLIWAYRYECRARAHEAQRVTLTVIMSVLLRCFGNRLETFSTKLMPDVMSLSVATELPLRPGWVTTVNFNTTQPDVLFKKTLIHLSVAFIKIFPCNRFMIESQHWLVGLMYLLDPGLALLRPKWPEPLYDELRHTALQALVCVLPLVQTNVPVDCGLIRRIMWYVEWYSWNPYELGVLYWCMRLLLVTLGRRGSPQRPLAVQHLFESHGVIIIMHLCSTLVQKRDPPVEMCQVILALSLRVLERGIEGQNSVKCSVYPNIVWPISINSLARTMMNVIMHSLERSFIISDRWLISLLNFIWEGIIWRDDYRKRFLASNGVYQLLDLITMVRAPVQCVALALVCDVTSAGDAVSQLVSWRAGVGASNVRPRVVKTGATIASLLASIFRDECHILGVELDEVGIIQDLNNPLRSASVRKSLENPKLNTAVHKRHPICYAAADLAGSRMSKAYALLQMLSQDLSDKVSIADEAYNLYKHIQLAPEDEIILILCSHFLTAKLMETWNETQMQSPNLERPDTEVLEEFLHISKGWSVEIKRQQEVIVEKDRKKRREEECSLYEFLGRVRLNTALDALREVRRCARASSRGQLLRGLLADAVAAHHRRTKQADDLGEVVLRTFQPPLDNQNITAQYVKTYCIANKQDVKIDCQSPTALYTACFNNCDCNEI